jgi:uncharacterized coiled-coil DUF342 family protein
MVQRSAEHGVKNIERRLTAVEQILPTLATKTDLEAAVYDLRTEIQAAIAPLATKADVRAEIQAAIAPLAIKAEVTAVKAEVSAVKAEVAALNTEVTAVKAELYAAIRTEGIETRRHFDVVAEGMHADIRMLAEGIVAAQARCDTRHHDVMGTLNEHDRRLTQLEARPSKRR